MYVVYDTTAYWAIFERTDEAIQFEVLDNCNPVDLSESQQLRLTIKRRNSRRVLLDKTDGVGDAQGIVLFTILDTDLTEPGIYEWQLTETTAGGDSIPWRQGLVEVKKRTV